MRELRLGRLPRGGTGGQLKEALEALGLFLGAEEDEPPLIFGPMGVEVETPNCPKICTINRSKAQCQFPIGKTFIKSGRINHSKLQNQIWMVKV